MRLIRRLASHPEILDRLQYRVRHCVSARLLRGVEALERGIEIDRQAVGAAMLIQGTRADTRASQAHDDGASLGRRRAEKLILQPGQPDGAFRPRLAGALCGKTANGARQLPHHDPVGPRPRAPLSYRSQPSSRGQAAQPGSGAGLSAAGHRDTTARNPRSTQQQGSVRDAGYRRGRLLRQAAPAERARRGYAKHVLAYGPTGRFANCPPLASTGKSHLAHGVPAVYPVRRRAPMSHRSVI